MDQRLDIISILELRRLLVELKEARPDIGIRYRMQGQMWLTNFARIINVTAAGALFNDESGTKLFTVSDLASIIQFEIDHSFKNFKAHFHYTVNAFA